MAEPQPSKLAMPVRSRSPALAFAQVRASLASTLRVGQPGQPMRTLRRDGFVHLPRFLTSPEVETIRAAARPATPELAALACERPNNTLLALRWNDASVTPVLRKQSLLQRVRSATGGTDLRWISAYMSTKEPRSGPLWWHQDWWCWDHPVSFASNAPQVALLCYLDDTTFESGALRVLPGSHRSGSTLHARLPQAHRTPAHLLGPDSDAMRDQPAQVTPRVRAGDAVVLDYRVLHGTHPNASSQRRDCLILNFAPDWSSLPDEVRAHLIGSFALPQTDERDVARKTLGAVLPEYAGPQRDLVLRRDAPARFSVTSSAQQPFRQ